jgi:hypothetical protein
MAVTTPQDALSRTYQYQREGILLQGNQLSVDLSEPRTIRVEGINSKTGEVKDYLLKVTQSGKLLLI